MRDFFLKGCYTLLYSAVIFSGQVPTFLLRGLFLFVTSPFYIFISHTDHSKLKTVVSVFRGGADSCVFFLALQTEQLCLGHQGPQAYVTSEDCHQCNYYLKSKWVHYKNVGAHLRLPFFQIVANIQYGYRFERNRYTKTISII